ncbi:MAG: hypothetical protein J6J36_06825 [Clostridia bacterium]|nr:hypothetical protein [Clostridia bacterium]
MKYEEILQELKTRKKGTIISIEYKSNPTLNAVAKKSGILLEKYTITTGRFGVNYSNIKAVKEQRELDKQNGVVRQPKTIWWNWLENNTIKEHTTNGNKYLTITTSKLAKPKVKYVLNGKEISKEDLQKQNIVINSYWSEKEPIQQYDININNIISIKKRKC